MQRNIKNYTNAYQQSPFEPVQAKYRRELVLRLIEQLNPTSILEIGCAEAPIFTDLSAGTTVTVVEPSPVFAENARRQAIDYPNARVIEGFIEDQQIGENYGMVLLSSVLHEVVEPESLLKAIHQLCGQDTLLHINVPNANSLHRQLAVAMGLMADVKEISGTQKSMQQVVPAYDFETLVNLVRRAGFDVVEKGGMFVKPFTHAQMQHLLDHGFLNQSMLDGFSKLAYSMPEMASEIWLNVKKCND